MAVPRALGARILWMIDFEAKARVLKRIKEKVLKDLVVMDLKVNGVRFSVVFEEYCFDGPLRNM